MFSPLLALPTGAFRVPQPNKVFPRCMDVSPPEEETKHSWERRQRIAYKRYLCSWGQSFCDEASKSLPPCSSSPHHPLCISACNEWRVPLHFPALCVSTVFPWSLLQLYISYPSLPLLQASHLPPHMGALWEGKPGQWSPSWKQLRLQGHPYIFVPGSFGRALNRLFSGTAVRLLLLVTVSTMQCFSLAAWTLWPSSHEFVHRVVPAF